MDLNNIFNKFPEVGTNGNFFYSSNEFQALINVGTDAAKIEKLKNFLKDVEGSPIEFILDISKTPKLISYWEEFDGFFKTKDNTYWAAFNNPPTNLPLIRSQALKAVTKYPDDYVKALEKMGLSKGDLFTRHGVDYGDEFFNIINDFKAVNSNNLTNAEIYSIFGYTTNFFYWDLNNWLRSGINQSKTQDISDLIESGLNKLPSWSDNIAYRGIKVKPPNVQQKMDDILDRYPTNEAVPHGEFISVGSTPQASFLNNSNVKIKMIFELKPNSTARDISALADGIMYRGNPSSELLFPPNTSFDVKSKSLPDDNGVVTIVLTEL